MPDHVVLVRNPISTQHVSRDARDFQRFSGRVSLHDRDHFRRRSTAHTVSSPIPFDYISLFFGHRDNNLMIYNYELHIASI